MFDVYWEFRQPQMTGRFDDRVSVDDFVVRCNQYRPLQAVTFDRRSALGYLSTALLSNIVFCLLQIVDRNCFNAQFGQQIVFLSD